MQVHLLASTNTYDLPDTRPSPSPAPQRDEVKNVGPQGCVDTVVSHLLSELGTHTLRVTITYTIPGQSEVSV